MTRATGSNQLSQQSGMELVRCATEIVEDLIADESQPVVVASIQRHDDGTAELTFRTSAAAIERDRLRVLVADIGAALNDIDDEVTEACGLGSDPSRTIAYQLAQIREALHNHA